LGCYQVGQTQLTQGMHDVIRCMQEHFKLVNLAVGDVGQELTRDRLRAKKKKMSQMRRLSIGNVGQELTMGRI
jgi:hypothetical protein